MGNLTGKEVAQMHKDYVMQSWSKSGVDALPVEKAKGIYFWDYDGKKYADMASLLVCSNLGHELPEIVEAIKEQADKMCFMAPAYASEPKSKLAKMLVEAAGADHFKRVFFTNGGAESNENAIKMARMVTGKYSHAIEAIMAQHSVLPMLPVTGEDLPQKSAVQTDL
jgi:taurine--2-oxoglutarate transaminase